MVLACPLCMGLDIMAEEQVFLEKYHGRPPIEAYDAREARINARRAELGYDEQDEQDEQPEQDQYDEVHYRLTRSRVAQQIQMSI